MENAGSNASKPKVVRGAASPKHPQESTMNKVLCVFSPLGLFMAISALSQCTCVTTELQSTFDSGIPSRLPALPETDEAVCWQWQCLKKKLRARNQAVCLESYETTLQQCDRQLVLALYIWYRMAHTSAGRKHHRLQNKLNQHELCHCFEAYTCLLLTRVESSRLNARRRPFKGAGKKPTCLQVYDVNRSTAHFW